MPVPLDMLCVLGSALNRRLPSTDVFWNETASSGILVPPPEIFFSSQRFCVCADGLWHPRTELDHHGLHSVWSQVTDFLKVELRLVVISQKWKLEGDILLREARALFRGVQVMVCAEHVRNARVLCLIDSSLVRLHLNADVLGIFKLFVQIRKLTSLCLCHQIKFQVRWIASKSNCSDDASRRHDSSQRPSRDFSNNIFYSFVLHMCR